MVVVTVVKTRREYYCSLDCVADPERAFLSKQYRKQVHVSLASIVLLLFLWRRET